MTEKERNELNADVHLAMTGNKVGFYIRQERKGPKQVEPGEKGCVLFWTTGPYIDYFTGCLRPDYHHVPDYTADPARFFEMLAWIYDQRGGWGLKAYRLAVKIQYFMECPRDKKYAGLITSVRSTTPQLAVCKLVVSVAKARKENA